MLSYNWAQFSWTEVRLLGRPGIRSSSAMLFSIHWMAPGPILPVASIAKGTKRPSMTSCVLAYRICEAYHPHTCITLDASSFSCDLYGGFVNVAAAGLLTTMSKTWQTLGIHGDLEITISVNQRSFLIMQTRREYGGNRFVLEGLVVCTIQEMKRTIDVFQFCITRASTRMCIALVVFERSEE